jgi:hypothetical protein
MTNAEKNELVRLIEREMHEQTGRKLKFRPNWDHVPEEKLMKMLRELREKFAYVH